MDKETFLILFLLLFSTSVIKGGSIEYTTLNNEPSYYNDTIPSQPKRYKLDSVTVRSAPKRGVSKAPHFAVGSVIERIKPEVLDRMVSLSLSDLIKEQSTAFIKEYGRGMASYLSLRGTSSSHTAISWNGTSLTIPTLGQTNLSQVPLYFFDKVDLHIGGSGLLYGDGAIGGSLRLETAPRWVKGVSGDLLLSGGSYATGYSAGTIRYSNGRDESRTSLFYSTSKNNFSFINNTKIGFPKERLNNSGYANWGALQEYHHKFKDSSLLSMGVWYLLYDRQIQPSVSLNDRPEHYASVLDKSIRATLNYGGSRGALSYSVRGSYTSDYQLYNKDIIETNSYASVVEGEYRANAFVVKLGGSAQYTLPTVHSYEGAVEESRLYLYTVARYVPQRLPQLMVAGGVRVGRVTNGLVPVMPSIEMRYALINRNGHSLSVRGALSRNGRVPTLNDRYWGGVHTYLKSENGVTAEGGGDYNFYIGARSATLSVTLYRNEVENWIRWLPAGAVWRPQNIPEVLARGGEFTAHLEQKIGEINSQLSLGYSYTSIIMIKGLRAEDPAQGQQLAFQPKHSVRGGATLSYKTLSLFTTLSYTGQRSTLDIFDILKGYFLLDMGAEYKGVIGEQKYTITLLGRNLTNANYQNVKFYAMPGFNFNIALRIFF